MMGMGLGDDIFAASVAVVIEDYMFESTTANELTPLATGTASDFNDAYDLDGTDYMPEAAPDDEGYWDIMPELITNGAFDSNTTGWTLQDSATLSSDSGRLKIANEASTNHGSAYQIVTVVVGNVYEIVADLMFSAGTAVDMQFKLGTGLGGIQYYNTGDVTADTTVTTHILATSTSLYVQCQNSGNAGTNAYFDNVSVTEYAITPLDV